MGMLCKLKFKKMNVIHFIVISSVVLSFLLNFFLKKNIIVISVTLINVLLIHSYFYVSEGYIDPFIVISTISIFVISGATSVMVIWASKFLKK